MHAANLIGRRAALAGFVTSLLLITATGSASAALVSGSNLAEAPNNTTCIVTVSNSEQSCTMTVGALPAASQAPGGTTAAISGVIVNWKVRIGASVGTHPVRLRVVRGKTGVGTGPIETLPATPGIHSFAARLPVQAGDAIGFDQLDAQYLAGVQYIRTTVPGAQMGFWVPPLGDGETRAQTAPGDGIELLMNATIEPDADGDGYGDESQDQCLGSVAAIAPCPPPLPSPVAPETKLGKGGPKGAIDKARATFRFTATVSGSTFRCRLDRKPWKPCKSPKTYRGLSEGRHVFKVKAVGPTGLVDSSPAKRTFKVEL